MKRNKVAWVAMVSAFLVGFIPAVWAEDSGSGDYIKHRAYVGILGISSNIDNTGDFNGTGGFISPSAGNEIDIIPAISRNFGFAGMAGYREGAYAVEVSYWRSDHDATWLYGAPPTTFYGTASFQSINIDLKRYLFTKFPTQPFFSLGFSLPWVVTHNGSTLDAITFSDSTIQGLGFNLGVGLEIYMGSDFSIVGGAIQRWAGFSQINGFSGQALNKLYVDGDPNDVTNLKGDGLNFYVGGTVGFE